MLLDTHGRELSVGQEGRGALSSSDYVSADDKFLEAWSLEGRAGDTVTIDLTSDDFDTYLYLVGPGLAETMRDDDGGGGCNARLYVTFLESGTFRVVASSAGPRTTGPYVIQVYDEAPATPAYGCGEVNPAVVESLETGGRSLRLGRTVSGTLSSADQTIESGRPAQAWQLRGRAGDAVVVTLESDAFDAYLYLAGPGLDQVLADDDSAGDLNSRISLTFPESAVYTVVVSALEGGGSGAYTLRVEEPLDPYSLSVDGRVVRVGDSVTGRLTGAEPVVYDGRPGLLWALDGQAGETVTIDLRSQDFDSYLYLVGPGLTVPLSDDDSAGDLDSRISLSFPETGSYRVVVSALGAAESGSYTLSVRR